MLEQNFEKTTDIVKRANANEQAIITTPTMLTPQEQMLLYLSSKPVLQDKEALQKHPQTLIVKYNTQKIIPHYLY